MKIKSAMPIIVTLFILISPINAFSFPGEDTQSIIPIISLLKNSSQSIQYTTNFNGNILNGGAVYKHNGWLYYSAYNPGVAKKWGTYRVKPDGSELTYIDPNRYVLFCSEGDYIYMVSKVAQNPGGIGIFKMATTGPGKDIPVQLTDYYVDYLYIQDGWLYFNKDDDIYKMEIDGADLKPVYDAPAFTKAMYLTIVDEWIYFENASRFCRIKKDGTDYTVIFDFGTIVGNGSLFQVSGDYFYYDRDPQDQIFRKRLDGTGDEQQISETTELNFNLQNDGYIYILSGPVRLHRVKLDGTDESFLTSNMRTCLVFDGWIYSINKEILARIKCDGSISETLVVWTDYEDI